MGAIWVITAILHITVICSSPLSVNLVTCSSRTLGENQFHILCRSKSRCSAEGLNLYYQFLWSQTAVWWLLKSDYSKVRRSKERLRSDSCCWKQHARLPKMITVMFTALLILVLLLCQKWTERTIDITSANWTYLSWKRIDVILMNCKFSRNIFSHSGGDHWCFYRNGNSHAPGNISYYRLCIIWYSLHQIYPEWILSFVHNQDGSMLVQVVLWIFIFILNRYSLLSHETVKTLGQALGQSANGSI